jgi:hypothetical protein
MTDRFLYLVYSFILFSRFYNQLSSMPKEEGEQLQETEDEEELEDEESGAHDSESPSTA